MLRSDGWRLGKHRYQGALRRGENERLQKSDVTVLVDDGFNGFYHSRENSHKGRGCKLPRRRLL